MSRLERIHAARVHPRRIRVLADHFAPLIPAGARVLDVGCGDGRLGAAILEQRADLDLQGVDVLVRPQCAIEVEGFDGVSLPRRDDEVDAVLLVDVLHHAAEPTRLLEEAARISRRCVLLKDHLREGLLAGATLRFMDRVGNARHGVALRYEYWRREQWEQVFRQLALAPTVWRESLGLYPRPARWIFERGLHFVTRLEAAPDRARSGRCRRECRGSR